MLSQIFQGAQEATDPIQALLQAMDAQQGQMQQANQVRQTAMNRKLPQHGRMDWKDGLAAILAQVVDPKFNGAQNAVRTAQGRIQGQYEDQMAQFNQEGQAAELRAQGLEQQGRFGLDKAKLGYDVQMTKADRRAREAEMRRKYEFDQSEAEKDRQSKLEIQKMMQAGKLSVQQWTQLSKIPPEARAAFARDQLGILDPDVLDGLSYTTPKENQAASSANLNNTKAEDIKLTREARLNKLVAEGDLAGARKLYTDTQREYRRVMTELAPKESAAKIANYGSMINARHDASNRGWANIEIARKRAEKGDSFTLKDVMKAEQSVQGIQADVDELHTENQALIEQWKLAKGAGDEKRMTKLSDAVDANSAQYSGLKRRLEVAKSTLMMVQGKAQVPGMTGGQPQMNTFGQTPRDSVEMKLMQDAQAAIAGGAPESAVRNRLVQLLQKKRSKK